MRRTFKAEACVANAGGAMGGKIKGTSVTGEMYMDGEETDFSNPMGKSFTFSGKVLGIQNQGAIDLLKKYKMYDKVVGVEVGGIKISINKSLEIAGSWENDKITVSYEAQLSPNMDSMRGISIKIIVKGFFNSMAINNVIVVGSGIQAQKEE
jgi:hypothetical protein